MSKYIKVSKGVLMNHRKFIATYSSNHEKTEQPTTINEITMNAFGKSVNMYMNSW